MKKLILFLLLLTAPAFAMRVDCMANYLQDLISSNVTTLTQTVTLNVTNTVNQTNYTTVNVTNTILQTNVINGGVATSGWPTNWPWANITNQPIIPSTNGFVTASIITGLATTANVVAATNGLGSAAFTATTAYDASGKALEATNGYPWGSLYDAVGLAKAATNTLAIVRSNSTLFVLNPGSLFSGIITNRVGMTNRIYVTSGVITNKTIP